MRREKVVPLLAVFKDIGEYLDLFLPVFVGDEDVDFEEYCITNALVPLEAYYEFWAKKGFVDEISDENEEN